MIYKTNYTSNLKFLISNKIYEYDISKANINILYHYGKITDSEYETFHNMSREDRQKAIGIMILNNRELYNIIHNGIIEMRMNFFESNNIKDDSVLSCRNDAIFLINTKPCITKFDNIEFVLKNTYTSFFKTRNLEFYYYNNPGAKSDKLDVKGISDWKLSLHEMYMIDFLKSLFESIDFNIEDSIYIVRSFREMFMNNELDIGYYRNFDADSLYKVNIMGNIYDLETIDKNNIDYIVKDCNIELLMELWQIITYIHLYK